MDEMSYSDLAETYKSLESISKRLEKEKIIAEFLKKICVQGKSEWIYLLKGKVTPDYDARELGISRQLTIKAISRSFGIEEQNINSQLKEKGDLGLIAEHFAKMKKQSNLFSGRLNISQVFSGIKKLLEREGNGTVDKKMAIISELLGRASALESRYIVRTLLSDLRIGVSDGTIRDSIVSAFFLDQENAKEIVQRAYDLSNDFAIVLESASRGIKELEELKISPGRPMNLMLAIKVKNITEAFEMCGKPAAFEYKYDGFRVLISKQDEKIRLFTRRLEEVTKQFPDVVSAIRDNVQGKSFMLDSEVVGFDKKSGKYLPFQNISQRIKRKYGINEIIQKLPVEVNVFDVLFLDGQVLISKPFFERRKIVQEIVKKKKSVIRPSQILITSCESEAEEFYSLALKNGEEGVMIKNLSKEYQPGRKVGFMAKLKPEIRDLDLTIVGAEYGTGKRGGWLTSYIVACRDESGKFYEVGKVSSGLKEKEDQESFSYDEMTKILKPLIIEDKDNILKISPKIVVSVNYQNIQKSSAYDSGMALRFPRITSYRPDRRVEDIASLSDIQSLYEESSK